MKKLHLQDNVVFTGYVSEDEKAFYYNAADVFVMPNRELENGDVEGFGIVFLEANIYGKPVIGGRSGGAVDAIVDGKTGLLVNPIDIEEIASAIIRFLSNEGYAKQLGFQGRKRVERDFNCEVIVSRMRIELEKL
jgi:phosphatidylinositol alpha-1,6-mannosyltransferase